MKWYYNAPVERIWLPTSFQTSLKVTKTTPISIKSFRSMRWDWKAFLYRFWLDFWFTSRQETVQKYSIDALPSPELVSCTILTYAMSISIHLRPTPLGLQKVASRHGPMPVSRSWLHVPWLVDLGSKFRFWRSCATFQVTQSPCKFIVYASGIKSRHCYITGPWAWHPNRPTRGFCSQIRHRNSRFSCPRDDTRCFSCTAITSNTTKV